jgi:uncharacterized protein
VITVTGLSVTAVKATRLQTADEIRLGPDGADGNRRFFLIDDRGRMVNAKILGQLQTVVASFDGDRLKMTFPDGRVVEDVVSTGDEVQTRFFSRARRARIVEGPWSGALSALCGRGLRLVEADGDGAAVDRGRLGAATLISRASLRRLADAAGTAGVDERRFRMLIEIDGVEAHEEDAWVGRRTRVGEALIAWGGHVGRCLTTSRDPDNGKVDLPTLDILRDYRGRCDTTEPLPFGIYGAVIEPGVVRVGDPVSLSPT